MYLDARTWTPDVQRQALAWRQEFNLLTKLKWFEEKSKSSDDRHAR